VRGSEEYFMSMTFILIPGRTSLQGTSMNEGKLKDAYIKETNTLQMNPDDMTKLGFKTGDLVQVKSETGAATLRCQAAKAGELPSGVLFLPYGDPSSKLMAGETHGTGMPTSKGFDVTLQKAVV